MWLIDHNLPHTFYRVLKEKNISCQTTSFAKLGHLENGVLTRAAIDAGFTAIITRDKSFPTAAQDVLAKHPTIAVVIIRYNQSPRETLQFRFEEALAKYGMIKPAVGTSYWPGSDQVF